MPKLYLKGHREPILLDNKQARELKDQWLTRQLGDKVDLGEHVFEARDIKGIEGVPEKGEDVEVYDLDTPEQRQAIKDFEKQFDKFVAENPDKCFENRGRKVGYKEHWMYSLGLIGKPSGLGMFGVKEEKIGAYINFKNKWGALQDLRIRRQYAEGKEQESLGNLQGVLKEM